jgi:hypothetical protein
MIEPEVAHAQRSERQQTDRDEAPDDVVEIRKGVEMNARAELHCYHCGYVAARVEGKVASIGAPMTDSHLTKPATGPGFSLRPGRPPRCGRCGGPLYIDEVEIIRYTPTVIVPLPPGRRRGRPPKALAS